MYVMAMIDVTKGTIHKILIEDSRVVLDFWAAWCGPCKMISPKLELLSEEYQDITFGKVNVDDETELIKEFEIKSIPTVIAFKGLRETARRVGKASEEELRNFLTSTFATTDELDVKE